MKDSRESGQQAVIDTGNRKDGVPATGHQPDKGARGTDLPALDSRITIDDVGFWLMLRSPGGDVGHILLSSFSHWHTIACGVATPNGVITQKKPARVCRKCREALSKLRPAKNYVEPKIKETA